MPLYVTDAVRGEYCSWEHFNVSCGSEAPGGSTMSSVLLMHSAQYGRMRLGRCSKSNLGYLGCTRDVLDVMDTACSGRTSCDLDVNGADLRKTKPCSPDVTWYLEASYSCVRGMCVGDASNFATPPGGYTVLLKS